MASAANMKNKTGVISGVLAYAKVAESAQKYQSEDREYSVDVIVKKTDAKAWNKMFAKQQAKVIDYDEFKDKFKLELDDEYVNDNEVFVIKLKKEATRKGVAVDEKYRPRVFLDAEEDGSIIRHDITTSRLIANGSKAKVSYRVTSNDFGTFAKLNNILMNEEGFIEFESKGRGPGSEFDEAVDEVVVEPENKAATERRASMAKAETKSAKKAAPKVEIDDDDIPF